MNFSEFKKRLGAEPRSRDPEMLAARDASAQFESAAVKADSFEDKLEAVIKVDAPKDLLSDIQSISRQPVKRFRWAPLAMAASILLAVGIIGIMWQSGPRWNSVEEYVADHFNHDGAKLLASATSVVSPKEINEVMSALGTRAGSSLSEQIRYIKFCPTPNGRGAHMVMQTEQGPVTILYMPETRVEDGEKMIFEQQYALLLQLEKGSAAIISEQAQTSELVEGLVRASLKSATLDA